MKITLSKAQWQQIGKIAGWDWAMCSYCGHPLDKSDKGGVDDPLCNGLKCKMHKPNTPDTDLGIGDGICPVCHQNDIPYGRERDFPINFPKNKGQTPKDKVLKHIQEQTNKHPVTQEELNKIFNRNVTSALKSLLYKK